MNTSTQLRALVNHLEDERADLEIAFREESRRDTRYTLVVGTPDRNLLIRLAKLVGCPRDDLRDSNFAFFEILDEWNGRGEVDMRALADEFIVRQGEFFDFHISISELRNWADAEQA